jgi:hypothetical protein
VNLDSGIKGYTQWRKALWDDDGLRDYARRHRMRGDVRAVAEVIALFGINGRGCAIGTAKVAERIGCDRHTVGQHRRELQQRGWLTVTGQAGRCPVLSISLPIGASVTPIPIGGEDEPIGADATPLSDSACSDRASTLTVPGDEAPGTLVDPWADYSSSEKAPKVQRHPEIGGSATPIEEDPADQYGSNRSRQAEGKPSRWWREMGDG